MAQAGGKASLSDEERQSLAESARLCEMIVEANPSDTGALETLKETGISGDIRVKDLTDDQLIALRDHIEGTYKVEGDLRREVAQEIKRKIEIASYQGIRHRRSLPVRGQRTHTNARTRKGPKKTVGVKRKKGK